MNSPSVAPTFLQRIAPYAVGVLALSPVLALLTLLGDASWVPAFLGRCHPLVLHAPIGLVSFILAVEVVGLISFGRFQFPTRLLVFTGAATAVGSAVAGYLLMTGDNVEGSLVELHMQTGIAFAALTVVVAVVRFFPSFDTSGRVRWVYRGGLVLAGAAMIWSGHLGASMTHGEDFLSEHWLGREKAAIVRTRAAATNPAKQLQVFTDIVQPILEARCYRCHDAKKIKGGLRLDTWDGIQLGGDSGPLFIAGKPEESLMMQLMHLPPDDDDRMPPEGKPQPTLEEIELVSRWIAAGAPREATLGQLKADARWLELAGKLPALLAGAKAEAADTAADPVAKSEE